MVIDIKQIKSDAEKIAEKYGLKLVILYGSYAFGKERQESDIDIAVLGKKPVSFNELIDLTNDFIDVFKINEVDVKSLHNADPLFRYQVMQKGILLYGNYRDYLSFKAYAFRDYFDSQDLFKLKEIVIKKRLKNLNA